MTIGPLPTPWQLPFELAWEALRAGSRPVGAVLYDPEGNVVAAGRNRRVVFAAPDDQWRGIERVPEIGGAIATRWARREGPLTGVLRPLARFGGLLMEVWEARHRPERVPAYVPARRLLDAGLLDVPTAEAAYAIVSS
ncbi:hypothetical protein ACH47Z_15585 [Streptomyces sp. NPDC020192]|uniref:hypothetical protein n=1 Tax=Streptomyces sp. NPDC020192 TaxID=3365066 RepID=UPI0037B27451